MSRQLGKKNIITPSIKNGVHIILAGAKVGKTTLVIDLAEKIFGSKEKALVVSCGNENAVEGISGAISENVSNWKELMEVVSILVKDNQGFDIVSFDTIDQIIPMAEAEVIRLHTVKYKEVPKSFNSCFGGYSEPRKVMNSLIDTFITEIMKIDAGKFLIAHNKVREIKSKLGEEAFSTLSTNLAFDNFHAFSYKALTIGHIVIDNVVENGVIQGKSRKIVFRDDSYILAGTRLKYLQDTIECDAVAYHDAIVQAIIDGGGNDEAEIKVSAQQAQAMGGKVEDVVEPPKVNLDTQEPWMVTEEELEGDESAVVADLIKQIIDLSTSLTKSGKPNKDIMKVLTTNGVKNPNTITDKKVATAIIEALSAM